MGSDTELSREGFNLFHFSNHVATPDQYSPHVIGTAGNEVWALGEWSMTIQSKNGGSPMQIKGNWLDILVRDGDGWKGLHYKGHDRAYAR